MNGIIYGKKSKFGQINGYIEITILRALVQMSILQNINVIESICSVILNQWLVCDNGHTKKI